MHRSRTPANPVTAFLAALLVIVSQLCVAAAMPEVRIEATPDDGVQPRLVTDTSGNVHLLYFKKRLRAPAAREGNLYYRQYLPEQGQFSQPIKVSSQAFNIQSYSIARAAMAIDGEGRAHVMWYLPRSEKYFYARSNAERTAFEEQRSMVTDYILGHDAGGDIAAFGNQVAIVWGAGDLSREAERTMFARFSHDGGATFGRETMISNPDFGACGCCSLAADYLSEQELLVAYRSAIDGVGRHMQLLTVEGVDNAPTGSRYADMQALREWEASFCPLSTNDIAANLPDRKWLVFETQSRIVQMSLPDGDPQAVREPFSETRQKNPAVASNAEGQRLIAWGEAISHTRGGRLNMQLFDEAGVMAGFDFNEDIAIGEFSFPAVAAIGPNSFLVLY
jgi:hypothetical protein